MDEIWKNNSVRLCGTLAAPPSLSHVSKDEEFFTFPLEVERLSGNADTINVIVRRALLEEQALNSGTMLRVLGELRTFNNKSGSGSRLVITAFAKQIEQCDAPYENSVHLQGTLCKPPNLRRTPMGRDICDMILAVGRRYGRSDYLPCILWGKLAMEAAHWCVGEAVILDGRIQSRKYIKLENGLATERTAYEVSAVSAQREEDERIESE